MPKIMVSLAQRGTPSLIINMIVRPCRSTLRLSKGGSRREALEGRLSKGGSRRVEFLYFRHFRSF